MEPIFELQLSLPRRGSRDLLRAVHGQLRSAILDGRLQGGLRLPATRALAARLGISRNSALAAYDLLLSEGYLVARPGAGTYVATVLAPRAARKPASADAAARGRLATFWRAPPAVPAPTPA